MPANTSPNKKPKERNKTNKATWLKNATKSIGMVGLDVLKELNPNISEITTGVYKTGQEVYDTVRRGNVSADRVTSSLKNNRYVKLADTAVKNALEDLKTGNFNNNERLMNQMFGDSDDSGMSFGDFDSDEEDSSPSINIVDTGMSAKAAASINEVSVRNTQALIKTTKASMDAQIATTSATMVHLQKIGNTISDKLDTTNAHLAAIVEFNNTNMTKFIESAAAYYEKVGASVDSSANNSKQKMTAIDVLLGSNGGLNFDSYKKLIQQQAKDYFKDSQAGFVTGMIDSFGEQLVSSPLQMISKIMVEQAIPEMVKTTMESVDEAIGGALITTIQQVTGDLKNNTDAGLKGTIGRFLGKTFGLDIKNTKEFSMAGKVTAAPATFDGYTYNNINEVIPKYLRESTAYLKNISEYLTGDSNKVRNNADIFDYSTGTYRKSRDITREFYANIRDTATNALRESSFGKAIAKAGVNENVDYDDYNNMMNEFMYKLVQNGTPNFKNPNWMDEIDALLKDSKGSETSRRFLRAAVQNSMDNEKHGATMAPGILAGRAARNRLIEDIQTNPSAYNYYATNPEEEEIDDTLARVLYGDDDSDQTNNKISRSGSIVDILHNMNFLLERGINVRVTGKKAFKKTDGGSRPSLRGVESGVIIQQEKERPPQNKNQDASLTDEDIRSSVEEAMQDDIDDQTVSGWVGSVRDGGKTLVRGIYDIMLGRRKEGLAKVRSVVDKNGKAGDFISNKVLGNKVETTDENGKTITQREGGFLSNTVNKVNKVGNMSMKDAKGSLMDFLFGSKQTEESLRAAGVEGNELVGQRLGSKNGFVHSIVSTFTEGMNGFYESFFGVKIDKNATPEAQMEQAKKGIKDKVDSSVAKLKDSLPPEIRDFGGTVKNGALRGLGAGAIGMMVGGPIGGAIGASVGIFTKSKTFQDFLYGEEDENGVRGNNGFKKRLYDKWAEFQDKHHLGQVVVDPNDPSKTKRVPTTKSKMMALGTSLGFLASMFTPIGPIGGAAAGLATGLIAGEGKVHDFLFGTKNKETGETEEAGLFGRLYNLMDAHWFQPVKNSASHMLENARDYMKDHVLGTLSIGLDPIATLASGLLEDTADIFRRKMDQVVEGARSLLDRVTNRLAGFITNNVIKQFANSRLGKALGGVVSKTASALNPLNIVRNAGTWADNKNRQRSKNRVLRELRDQLEGMTDETEKRRLRVQIAQIEQGDNPDITEQAETAYYKSDFRERMAEHMSKTGKKNAERDLRQREDNAKTRNQQFITAMTNGRLKEDTPENRRIALEIANNMKKRKYRGFNLKDFQFEDYSEYNEQNAEQADSNTKSESDENNKQTADNTASIAKTSELIHDELKDTRFAIESLAEKIAGDREKNGGFTVDKEDSQQLRDLLQKEKELKRDYRNERIHDYIGPVTDRVKETISDLPYELEQMRDGAIELVGNMVVETAKLPVDLVKSVTKAVYEMGAYDTYEEHKEGKRAAKREKKFYGSNQYLDAYNATLKELMNPAQQTDTEENQQEEATQPEATMAESSQVESGNGIGRGYANGTSNATAGFHLVGERGPEVSFLPQGSKVVPNDQSIRVQIVGINDDAISQLSSGTKENPLTSSIGGSRNILPVYMMGKLGSKTANAQRILNAAGNDDNIPPELVDDDINDDRESDTSAKQSTDEDESKDENNGKGGFINKVIDFFKDPKGTIASIFGNLKNKVTEKAGKFASTAGTIVGQVAPTVAVGYHLADMVKNHSAGNDENFALDENGNLILNEDGTPQLYDATEDDKNSSMLTKFMNWLAPNKTQVNEKTGELETTHVLTSEKTRQANNLTRSAIQVGQNVIPRVKKILVDSITTIAKKLSEFCTKHGWSTVASKIDDMVMKYAPKITEKALTKNSGIVSKFMSKVAVGSSTFMVTELISAGIGGILGATNPGHLFDVNMNDPALSGSTKTIMRLIAAFFKGFQNTILGSAIDLIGIILGTDIIKIWANGVLSFILDAISENASEQFAAAQDNFKSDYAEYSQQEYEKYKANAEATGGEVLDYETFQSTVGTDFNEYNDKTNQGIVRKTFNAISSLFKTSDSKKESSSTGGATVNYQSPMSQALDTSMIYQAPMSQTLGGMGGVPYYSQNDPRWKNASYGDRNDTMGTTGCGPTAMAMAASGVTGKNIDPMQMAGYAEQKGYRDNTGTNAKFIDSASSALGISSKSMSKPNTSFVDSELSKGKPIVLLGRDGGYGGSAFTKAGHYVVATGETKNGGIVIQDPRGKRFSGVYDKNSVLGESAKAWSLGGRGPSIGDLRKSEYTGTSLTNATGSTGTKVLATDVINVAQNEVGYLEKASNQSLENKTENSGKANFTKYGAWIGVNGQPWCASFVCWVFATAANGDKDIAKKLLFGDLSASANKIYTNFQNAQRIDKTPKPGDVIFFHWNSGHAGANHVGIVIAVNGTSISTIEGNTSSKLDDINGGGVSQKQYQTSNAAILGYGRPLYDNESQFKGVSAYQADGSAPATDGTSSSGSAGGALTGLLSIGSIFDQIAEQQMNWFSKGGKLSLPSPSDSSGTATDVVTGAALGSATAAGASSIAATFAGSQNAESAFKYFRDTLGYSDAASAAIVGNLQGESGPDLNPARLQNSKGPAAGLAQWENYTKQSGRWKELSDFAQSQGKEWTDFGTQLQFIDKELSGSQKRYFTLDSNPMKSAGATPTTYEDWKQSTDVDMATRQFEGAFERAGKPRIDTRISYAKGIYDAYAKKDNGNINSIGDLKKSEYGGSGGVDYYDYNPLYPEDEYIDEMGGYGSATQGTYTPSKSISTRVRTVSISPSTSSNNANSDAIKAIIGYLEEIASNTGASSSKLDYLRNLAGGNTYVNGGKGNIQVQANPTNFPSGKTVNQQKAELIAKG